jgi:NADH-quinone oxidoreductase subunit M
VLASAGLPGLNGFVGEFMILLGAFKSTVLDTPGLVVAATTGVILAAVYLLHMVYRTFFGELTERANAQMADVNGREFLLMVPLIALMFVMGFFPNPFLRQTEQTTEFLLNTIEKKRAAALEEARSTDPTAKVPAAPPEVEEVTIEPEELSIEP